MQEDHALTAAIKALYATLQRYPTHAPDVAERAQRLANFHLTDGVLSFTLERHPHILGRLTQGMASSGYFLVEQRYVFSLEQETITLTQEHCTGWEADAEALADENVETVLDYGGLAPEYRTCASEDEVRARAAC